MPAARDTIIASAPARNCLVPLAKPASLLIVLLLADALVALFCLVS